MTPAPKKKTPPCPNCGRLLAQVARNADTPPWLCADCSRGWWQAELDWVAFWRNVERDFGTASVSVLIACEAERVTQHGGGHQ